MTWFGVAGWDYPDWAGIVYPSASGRGFDRLAWLARFVDVIEINSTFYRPVRPRAAASWARRVTGRPGFRFTAKAHRALTHEPWSDPVAVAAPTLSGLAPLHEAGLLGALLLQYPHAFRCTEANLASLLRLLDALGGWPAVVEVRHASWDDDRAAAALHERRAGWCVVDQPAVGRSTIGAKARVTSEVGYLRLHGRNAAAWFDATAGRDRRYDYLYAEDELVPLAETARLMAGQARALFAVANNHFRGQAVVAALQLKHLVSGVVPEAPAELVAAYPALGRVTRPRGGRLL